MTCAQKIRDLNDVFRSSFTGGRIVVTRGLAERDDLAVITSKVKTFDRFSADNDPHGEHDFGSFEHCGETIFWKIDCYHPDMRSGSDDPSNAAITTRILTIMLADEY